MTVDTEIKTTVRRIFSTVHRCPVFGNLKKPRGVGGGEVLGVLAIIIRQVKCGLSSREIIECLRQF